MFRLGTSPESRRDRSGGNDRLECGHASLPFPYRAYNFARRCGSTLIFAISPPAHCISFGSMTLNQSHGMAASPNEPG